MKERLVTVESTIVYALEESLNQELFEPVDSEGPFSVVVSLDTRGCPACMVSELVSLNAYWDLL